MAPDPVSFAETDGVFHGAYVGRADGTRTVLAVSVPPPDDDGHREVTLFFQRRRGVFELFPDVADNAFEATSNDGDARAKGQITG